MDIEKNNGELEEFDREKVIHSIRKAGAGEKVAREIARKVREKEGLTTEKIRRTVMRELRKMDPESAERYDEARCLVARMSVEAARGIATLSNTAMSHLRVRPGDNIDIQYRDQRWTLKAQGEEEDEAELFSHNEITLHQADMTEFDLSEGNRLVVRRHQ